MKPTNAFKTRPLSFIALLRFAALFSSVWLAVAIQAKSLDPIDYPAPVKVACVGDSITEGSGSTQGQTYPAQLQQLLGPNWNVRNFGVGGRTLLRNGDLPYWKESAYSQALNFAPDGVIIMLGANDSKPHNWAHKDEFAQDYRDLVNSFRSLPCHPHIYICRPTPVPAPGNYGINEPTVQEQIRIIDHLAEEMQLDLIDMHAALEGKDEMLPDRVHPNNAGYAEIAKTAALALTGGHNRTELLTSLNSLFRDHAVLPRNVRLPVWGTSAPASEITVQFNGQTFKTETDAHGRWEIDLLPLRANRTPQTLRVTGNRTVEASDLLVGDVWLASGQSNMERQLGPNWPGQKDIQGWKEAADAADLPEIREYYVPHRYADEPQSEALGSWSVCTPESVLHYSAIGFFFARDIHAAEQIPIGIIHSSWGGTLAEAWTSAGALKTLPDFRTTIEMLESKASPSQIISRWLSQNDPGSQSPGWEIENLEKDPAWQPVDIPSKIDAMNLKADIGVFWFRREFNLPELADRQPAHLHLGQIDDEDVVWINGVKIGANNRWNIERNYTVPSKILRAGKNIIAVRVINTAGQGGWISDPSDLSLSIDGSDASLSLAGKWNARLGLDLANHAPPIATKRKQDVPTVLYNAMIAPLPPFPIKGVLWYQGESNNDRPAQYRRLLPTLINDWRTLWRQPKLPFLIVQIAPYKGMSPEIREAQLLTVDHTPDTALIVTTDVGDANDIHPAHKAPVGQRLALAARALAYGENIVYSGPIYRSFRIKENTIQLSFDHTGTGLMSSDDQLKGFEVCGEDGVYHSATAEIHGEQVWVSSPEVSRPVSARYGWANVPEVNLFNKEGLPASPFRTNAPIVSP